MSTDAEGNAWTGGVTTVAPGIRAEIHLDHDRLPFRTALRHLGDASITPGNRATCDDRHYQFAEIDTTDVDRVDHALARDSTVSAPVLVERHPDRLVYRVELTEEAIDVWGTIADLSGRVRRATATATAWILDVRFPDREALVSFNRSCTSRDISVTVTQLRSDHPEATPVLGLTQKQQDILTVAYEEGYFDVPRGISQDDLAARLGVSKSAVSQRLRRAMNELCATTLGNDAGTPY